MVVALKPLHDRARIKRVVVSTYQSVSGSGKEAIDELWNQTKGIYVPGQEVAPKVYPKQIAFNVIPHIDKFMEDGTTKEEWKMVAETKKIIDKSIKVTATCVYGTKAHIQGISQYGITPHHRRSFKPIHKML